MSLVDTFPKARRKVTTYGKSRRKRPADTHDFLSTDHESKRRQLGYDKSNGPGDQRARNQRLRATTRDHGTAGMAPAMAHIEAPATEFDDPAYYEKFPTRGSDTSVALGIEPDVKTSPETGVQPVENMPKARDMSTHKVESTKIGTGTGTRAARAPRAPSSRRGREVRISCSPETTARRPRREETPGKAESHGTAQDTSLRGQAPGHGKKSGSVSGQREPHEPAADPQTSRGPSPAVPPVRSSEAGLPKQTRAPKLTYAAKSRTVLQDVDPGPFGDLSTSGDPSNLAPPSKRKRRLEDAHDVSRGDQFNMECDDDGVENGQSGSLKSFRELRQAGVNARAERETEALLDDICGVSPLSRRHIAMLDLALKAQSEPYITHMIANGWTSRVAEILGGEPDTVCRCLLASVLLSIVVSAPEADLSPFCLPGAQHSLSEMLTDPNDLEEYPRDPKSRFPRSSLVGLRKLCSSLSASSFWSFEPPDRINPRSLALQCLQNLAKWDRSNSSDKHLLHSGIVEQLVDGLDTSPIKSTTSHANNLLSLSILELAALDTDHQASIAWEKHVGSLISFLCALPEATPMKTWLGTLRLFLNITNNNAVVCDIISEDNALQEVLHMVEQSFEDLSSGHCTNEHDLKLDRLVLSLGVLINLAESSHHARTRFLQTLPNGTQPLRVLLSIFQKRLESAFEVVSDRESRLNVAFGYLAVVLVCLCLNDCAQSHIAAALEGGNLRQLLVTAEVFFSYHCQVATQSEPAADRAGSHTTFIDRLQTVVRKLEEVANA